MFDKVKEYTVSDYLMFKEDSLKGSEYGGEIEFDNGYGLSIVRHDMSYGGKMGLFEIMLIRNGEPYSLPPITQEEDTVNGFLTQSAVEELISTVEELPVV
jgi:hypothetical protein